MKFTAYKKANGEILFHGTADAPQELSDENTDIYEGEEFSGSTHYFNNGIPTLRPEIFPTLDKPQIAADGIEVATLSGLPVPCTLTLTDPEGKVSIFELGTDTETINTDLVGTHKVEVRAWPYLDWEGTFDGY